MALGIVTCPECEGYGKAVNNFDLPINQFDNRATNYRKQTKVYRSDGREFVDKDCPGCNGAKIAYV